MIKWKELLGDSGEEWMELALPVLVIVILGVFVVRWLRSRRGEARPSEAAGDTGLAILEFGRAFPDEPVRDVILTKDGANAFLRLADGRTGFLHTTGRHALAHVIEPAFVKVEGPVDETGLTIYFLDSSHRGGRFTFARTEDAAEVMLWLCGSLAAAETDAAGAPEAAAGMLQPPQAR